ncbi:MAG: glycosyltransferase [Thermodesulfobacteriota bacterium]
MKIAFIVSSFPSLSQTFILNQITGLLDLGHDVEIFAEVNPNEKKVHSDVEEYRLIERTQYVMPRNRIKRVLKAIYLIITNFHKSPIKILKSLNVTKYGKDALSLKLLYYTLIPFPDKKFDIIHCHFGPNGIIGVYLKEMGVPGKYVTSFHGYDINSYPRIAGENVYSELFSRVSCFTWNSNLTKKQLIELGCDQKKIIILPYGVRIERFRFIERKVRDEEPARILTVGRLVEKKGHEYAIKAIAEVVKRHRNIDYMIAGEGPSRSNLENLVLRLEIKNYVKFLGAVDQEEVLRLYEHSHIFLLSSVTASDGDSEGLPVVLLEAQAVGLPIISTLHSGIPEGVLDGKSGFLVPEKDVDALADKIEYLIEHPELWPDMGRCGRKFVEERYDIQKLNRRLVKIYKALLTNDTSTLEQLIGEQ